MSSVATYKNIAPKLAEGLRGAFGLTYQRFDDITSKIYNVESSNKKYEEYVKDVGLGLAQKRDGNQPFDYEAVDTAWKARFEHVSIGKSTAITQEAIDDNLYEDMAKRLGRDLALSMSETFNISASMVLRLGHTSVKSGDQVPLFSTEHPLKKTNTTNANKFATDADLGIMALQDMRTQMRNWRDEAGLRINVKPGKLIIPSDQIFQAHQVTKNSMVPGTANNDINTIQAMGLFQEVVEIVYLDPGTWFATTTAPDGLTCFIRRAVTMREETDFDTLTMRFNVWARRSWGVKDPLGVFKGA